MIEKALLSATKIGVEEGVEIDKEGTMKIL
jgi:hypothetical protein